MAIVRVWIEEGCTVCNECENAAPDVFFVNEDEATCQIRAGVREDGVTSENRDEKSPLKGTIGADQEEEIIEAADGCPVEIIKFETDE